MTLSRSVNAAMTQHKLPPNTYSDAQREIRLDQAAGALAIEDLVGKGKACDPQAESRFMPTRKPVRPQVNRLYLAGLGQRTTVVCWVANPRSSSDLCSGERV